MKISIIFLIFIGVIMYIPCQEIGLKDGKLLPCPTTPNCVCSEYQDDTHYIQALSYTGEQKDVMEKTLQEFILSTKDIVHFIENVNNNISTQAEVVDHTKRSFLKY